MSTEAKNAAMTSMSTGKNAAMRSFDLDGDGVIDETEMMAGMASLMAEPDRERVCNDVLNTSVMAALIGGFALGALSAPGEDAEPLDTYIYMLSYMTVHACTCSALTSAFIYSAVNQMEDDAVTEWCATQKILLSLPMIKFVMGCMAYMVSVILGSWRDLEGDDLARYIALAVGVMSVSSVWVAYAGIQRSLIKPQKPTTKPVVKSSQVAAQVK